MHFSSLKSAVISVRMWVSCIVRKIFKCIHTLSPNACRDPYALPNIRSIVKTHMHFVLLPLLQCLLPLVSESAAVGLASGPHRPCLGSGWFASQCCCVPEFSPWCFRHRQPPKPRRFTGPPYLRIVPFRGATQLSSPHKSSPLYGHPVTPVYSSSSSPQKKEKRPCQVCSDPSLSSKTTPSSERIGDEARTSGTRNNVSIFSPMVVLFK